MRTYRLLILLLMTALILVACGGSQEPEVPTLAPAATTPPEPTPGPTEVPTEVPVPTESGPTAASSFRDALNATIQIEAQGSFMDPEFGMQLNTAGRGSGFIIDPSGIAVTNNHVVTGAAFLQIYVQGQDEPLNARVLGVSECSDLAVIDIEGEGYPYLDWSGDPPIVGTEVYALGFPLGDPEPTITRGIISKERANGESSWASVNNVMEHDATINPGNSGGPLVDAQGKVVAVNYAGRSDTNQYFSISARDARPLVEQLRGGADLDSIGINGEAVQTEDGTTGIWVASVKSGSPADRTGVKAGDIITKLEGLVLSVDGTMSDYCDILRSRNPDDVMGVEVLRFSTEEFLEGQVNGRELETSFSFARAVNEEVVQDGGSDTDGGSSSTYANFVGIYDDSGAVYVEVPEEWSDIDGSNWVDSDTGSVIGSSLYASPSIADFNSTYTTPGVQILASAGLGGDDMNGLLDFFDFSNDCTYDSRNDYSDPVFTGVYDLYTDCAGEGSVIIVLAAQPADASHAVIVIAQAVSDADLDAVDQILNTFNVVDTLPGQ